jgi:hypothetical protein
VRFSPRQKGFVKEAGCYNNVQVFNGLLKMTKRKGGMTAVQLDVAKAFDTIPHRVIGHALQRKGIPETMIGLIEDSYRDIHTTITQGCRQVPMNIRRGVKQGDPLSPFIFKAVLEPLLLQLEEMRGFQLSDDRKVSSFAFAPEAENLFRKTVEYLRGPGHVHLGPKMRVLQCEKHKGFMAPVGPRIVSANGEKIPFAGLIHHSNT